MAGNVLNLYYIKAVIIFNDCPNYNACSDVYNFDKISFVRTIQFTQSKTYYQFYLKEQ